jgi:phosphoglycolate phosphatase-like HAD superfamily hydrolase
MYLILFDIDGTLCLTGRAGWRAMNRACQDVLEAEDPMAAVEFAGRTDWSILRDVMAKYGHELDAAMLADLRDRYVRYLEREIQEPGTGVKDVMPGIRPLLDALRRRDDVALALLTGNFIEGARIKLEYFDLWQYFPCGAFGGDSASRNDLVPVALTRARECGIVNGQPSSVLVIGDTPNDVECALVAGATPVGVATGGYSVGDLRAAGAEIVFEDLSQTEAFLRLLR